MGDPYECVLNMRDALVSSRTSKTKADSAAVATLVAPTPQPKFKSTRSSARIGAKAKANAK